MKRHQVNLEDLKKIKRKSVIVLTFSIIITQEEFRLSIKQALGQ